MAIMYNAMAEIENKRREEINAQTLRLASSGALDLREAKARHIPMVKLAKGSFSKKWASRFRKKWGFSHRAVNTAGIYMPYDHPYMVASRAAEERRISKEHIYRQLFLIYDQLWKKVYRGKKKKRSQASAVLWNEVLEEPQTIAKARGGESSLAWTQERIRRSRLRAERPLWQTPTICAGRRHSS